MFVISTKGAHCSVTIYGRVGKITPYRFSPESDAYRQLLLTDDLLLQGHWGEKDASVFMLLNVHGGEMAY